MEGGGRVSCLLFAMCPGLHVTTRSEMEALMKEMKIGPDTYVFAYDSENGVYASRFVWTMWYYGYELRVESCPPQPPF